MFKRIACIAALLYSAHFCLSAESPYGICAHVSRHGDHELAEQEFALMRRAGIRWARTDFDWTTVQPRQGVWDFAMIDATVNKAEQAGIEILPILAYDVAWARPAYKHLDAWLDYVRKTVSRYKDRLRYWEVWNEPDLEQFWHETPDPANYTLLLKATYEEIKRIDPELQVVLGGLSGIPYEYIEGIYKAQGAAYFDVMAVHPYRYPETPEARSLTDDLATLRELMRKSGDQNKPVWITEIGWPTHLGQSQTLEGIVRSGLKAVYPDKKQWTLAVFDDPAYAVQWNLADSQFEAMLPGNGKVVRIGLDQLQELSPQTYDALIWPPEEGFAVEYFDAIETFVKDGGTVIFTQGVPLYYAAEQDANSRWIRSDAGQDYRKRLHIGWEAWWTKAGVPKNVTKLKTAQAGSEIRLPENIAAERFLSPSELKNGDKFIPLLQADDDNYAGTAAAVFKLDSNLKGAVIVSTLFWDFRGIPEDRQAAILPRTYLIALHSGVEKVFWYNLRARENDPYYNEDHFGIVHSDLKPKPAYRAFEALNQARPAGSTALERRWQNGMLCCPGWKRPDGKTAFALWTTGPAKTHTFTIEGNVTEAFDHLGKPVNIQLQNGLFEIPLSAEPIYIIGPVSADPLTRD
jgi:hypothetical protein